MTRSGPMIQKRPLQHSQSYTPKDYQKRAIQLMISQACAGLFLDPGLGKTSITLAATSVLGQKEYIRGVLVIAPLRAVYNVWPKEIAKWVEFQDISIGILHGPDKLETLNEDHHVYAINPEGVQWLVEQLRGMKVWPFDMLVVDESTKFKDPQTMRFKAIRGLLGKFKRRYCLTGTPAPNGLMDLFGQIYILDQGDALGRFITHYRHQYFFQSGYGGYTWTPQFDAMDRITERIAPLTMSMDAEEYLQLPELVSQMTWLSLPTPARRIYKEIEKEFMTIIGDEAITAPNAAVAGGKCRQVLNGALYVGKDKDFVEVHNVKLDALEDLIDELSGQPLLVLYEFIHDKERILARFPDLNIGIIGGQSMKKDQQVIDAFNNGELRVVLGHPASMGHALNLQGACAHVCWFGLTWNFEHYDQAIRRVWRQGNEAQRVILHHLCIRDSLDETVAQALNDKDRTQATLSDGLRSLQRTE